MRADLRALTPEALAALANPGLVKRAQRENAAAPPAIEEAPDGLVVGTFADGAVARLPPGVTLKDAPCTCGAVGMCRHRVALALAYAGGGAPTVAGPETLDDAALARALGAERVRAAQTALEQVWPAEVDGGTVRFETCAVRFLAGADLAHARCDCAEARCVHVVLAVWAVRAGAARVTLGRAPAAPSAAAVGEAVDAVGRLLLDGLAHGGGHAQALDRARDGLLAAGCAWPAAILDELRQQLAGYADRHARHDASHAAALCAELATRARARGDARAVLGVGAGGDTVLDTARWIGLGARLEAGEADHVAEVYLADPEAGVVLVLPVRWPRDAGGEAAERLVAPAVTLGRLAGGQAVSRKAVRRPDRVLRLPGGRHTTVLGQTGDWEALPAALRVERVAAWRDRARERPPRWLRPRVRAEDVVAVRIAAVERVTWSPGAQTLRALARDGAGDAIEVVARWRAVAPHAVDAVAEALPRTTWIAGPLTLSGGLARLEPTALVAGGAVILPDLAGPRPSVRLPFAATPPPSALAEALADAATALATAAHLGLCARDMDRRADEAAARLAALGLAGVATRLRAFAAAARSARLDPARGPEAARAWAIAATRVHLATERADGA